MKISFVIVLLSLTTACAHTPVQQAKTTPMPSIMVPAAAFVIWCPKVDSSCFDIASTLCSGKNLGVSRLADEQTYNPAGQSYESWKSLPQPTAEDPNGDNAAAYDEGKNMWRMIIECKESL
jgi:hypothetical protein